jgi:glutamate--glyoxylate aminotransferase
VLCRFKADPDRIFLTDGASVGVRMCLNALIRDRNDAVLVPVPQYPLYSASVALYDGAFEGYLLDEAHGWSMDVAELQKTVDDAKAAGRHVRGLVFINPGNPTGQCLTQANLEDLIKFCCKNEIVLMADEVYQPNIYQDEKPFVSARCAPCCSCHRCGRAGMCASMHAWASAAQSLPCPVHGKTSKIKLDSRQLGHVRGARRKAALEMGEPYASGLELISFHTVSKGVYGECGLRGGYFEALNIHDGAPPPSSDLAC